MKITAVTASWIRVPIPVERAHVSDFGRNDSFNMGLVEIETDAGITGLGEAKAAVGNLGNYAGIVDHHPRGADARPSRPRPARHRGHLGDALQRDAGPLRPPGGPHLPDHRAAGHHAVRAQRDRHRPLGHPRQVARPAAVAAPRRLRARSRARLRERGLGAGGEDRRPARPVRRAGAPRREDAGRPSGPERRRLRGPRARGAGDARARRRHHGGRPRHLERPGGAALRAQGRGVRPRLARGAGVARQPRRPGRGAGRHRHPHRRRRERADALRLPRDDRRPRGGHLPARRGHRRRHHRDASASARWRRPTA